MSLNDFVMRQSAPPLILCIGSARVSGDCFGPMTGQLLRDFFDCPTAVYGTMRNPIHAVNLYRRLEQIRFYYPSRKIIAVDAAIGGEKGNIRIFPGPLRPGLATGKQLMPVGDYCVTATVGRNSKDELFCAAFESVLDMSIRAALIIRNAFGNGKCRSSKKELFLL